MSYGSSNADLFRKRRRLCRQDPQRRKTLRSSGGAADQVRAGHQPQDREGTRPDSPVDVPRPRRRGDRMKRREFIALLGGAAHLSARGARAAASAPRHRLPQQHLGGRIQAVRRCLLPRASPMKDLPTGKMSRSNTAGRTASTTGCRTWRASSSACLPARSSRSLRPPRAPPRPRHPPFLSFSPHPVTRSALGLVPSLNRPGGNLTGVNFLLFAMATKRLDLLSKLAPNADTIGLLVNPNNPSTPRSTADTRSAAETLGKRLIVGAAGTVSENRCRLCAIRRTESRSGLGGGRSVSARAARTTRPAGRATFAARHLSAPRECRSRRSGQLRHHSVRGVSPDRRLHRSHPQG